MDLLGITADNALIHIELQSTNDPNMALRMAEYCLRIFRQEKKFAKQVVLYVGERPLNMPHSLVSDTMNFSYRLLDVRELHTQVLLASPQIEDNLLAILTRLEDPAGTIREILARITALPEPDREAALTKFLLISELRQLSPRVEEEAMSLASIDAMLFEQVFGPKIRAGIEQGRNEATRNAVKLILETRFGPLSASVQEYLNSLSASDLDALMPRTLNAASMAEIFPA